MKEGIEKCPTCGATDEHSNYWHMTTKCLYCGSEKCSMCDLGDDVECVNCPEGDLDD